MEKRMAKIAILSCTKKVMDELKELITSVDSVNAQIKEVEELTKGMSPLEVLFNVEILAKVAAAQTKVKSSEEERAVIGKLVQSHLRLAAIYETEEIPTVREMANILAGVHLAIKEYETIFKDRDGVKSPSKELYEGMFSLVNARIIVQK